MTLIWWMSSSGLRPRIVVPLFVGSNPIIHPMWIRKVEWLFVVMCLNKDTRETTLYVPVAQLVERRPEEPSVVSSNLTEDTMCLNSSAEEQRISNSWVGSSNLSWGANFIERK